MLVVSRIDRAARREYVAAFNSSGSAVRVTVATATPHSQWRLLLGAAPAAFTGATGALTVTIPPYGSVLHGATAELPRTRLPKPRLTVRRDDLSELVRASATAGPAPLAVGFAAKRAGAKRWVRLSADDSPPYRAFLDPAQYRRGERVQLVAVARTLHGTTSVSDVVTFVPRR